MTNLFNLRPYQLDAVSQIEDCWAKGIQCVVCQLPTGGGKSRIIRQITDNYAANKKVIYLGAQYAVRLSEKLPRLISSMGSFKRERHSSGIVSRYAVCRRWSGGWTSWLSRR